MRPITNHNQDEGNQKQCQWSYNMFYFKFLELIGLESIINVYDDYILQLSLLVGIHFTHQLEPFIFQTSTFYGLEIGISC